MSKIKELMKEHDKFEEFKDKLVINFTETENGLGVQVEGVVSITRLKATIESMIKVLATKTETDFLDVCKMIGVEYMLKGMMEGNEDD